MEADDDQSTVAAVIVGTVNEVRTVGIAILSSRLRGSLSDVKTRSLRIYNFLADDPQHSWVGRILHGCEPTTVYVAKGLPEKELEQLKAA